MIMFSAHIYIKSNNLWLFSDPFPADSLLEAQEFIHEAIAPTLGWEQNCIFIVPQ